MTREHDDMNDDDGLEALLREVGARDEPSPAAMEEVRRAVHHEWRATVTQRKRHNRMVAFAIAASVAIVAVVATWTLRFADPSQDFAVTIAHIEGEARIQASQLDDGLSVGSSFPVGRTLSTDAVTRIAIAYGAGISIRIDRDSKIERVAPDRFRLSAGAVYIDAPAQAMDHAEGHGLVIETLAGEVQHLGTQYQIRQANDAVEVSIREGRVEVTHSNGAALASAGERLRIRASGQVDRDAISAQDPVWDWAEAATPPFAINDRTLAEFLEWVARETGREVAYASPDAQSMAQTVKLRGSIDGLSPDTALSAVLSTTEFARYDSGDGLIGVRLAELEDSK
jgi:ferric-dicitrate binding protein FerR (iron transport regulator)